MKIIETGQKDKEWQGQNGAGTVQIQRSEKPSNAVIFKKNQNEGEGRTLQAQGTAEVGICLELLGNTWEGGSESRNKRVSHRGWGGSGYLQNRRARKSHLLSLSYQHRQLHIWLLLLITDFPLSFYFLCLCCPIYRKNVLALLTKGQGLSSIPPRFPLKRVKWSGWSHWVQPRIHCDV